MRACSQRGTERGLASAIHEFLVSTFALSEPRAPNLMKPVLRSLAAAFLLALVFNLTTALAQPSVAAKVDPAAAGRERLSLDRGWLFHEGDIPFPVIIGHQASYNNAKAGRATGAAAPDYDDSSWRQVDLPHDWAVEQPFDEKANISQGYRARGMGWYRKYFRLDPADHGKHLEVQLDGVATHCTVWVNGVLAERNWCGYTSVYVDITPFAKFGSDVNVIAVQVDAVAQEGWWYEGAGIYRHTWLVKRNLVHIETDGVYANPVRDAAGQWSIPVEVALYNSDRAAAKVEVESTLIDPAGKAVVSGKTDATVDPLKEPVAKLTLAVASPKLWSLDEPTLYSVRTVVKRDGVVMDEVTTRCGFRTIRFDADKGFFLNDRPVKLLGTCNHQDMAGVGVAVPDSIWDFRVRRLKEMGSNAYRCAHNPPAAEFLEACDRQGMLVMDENRDFGSSPEYLKQLDWMVRRDRNHPSVILWSVFNEETSQGTEMGYEMVRRMSEVVKRRDTTRPVTAAQSNSTLNPVNASQAADVAGFNYVYREFDRYHTLNPSKPIFSSEDTSTVMTRDEYVTNRSQAVLDSYDDQLPGSWGLSHRSAWKEIASRPFVAGTMVWTGFDYRGEPQPLVWPATGSSFGIMDLCGFPKSAYWIHQAQWIADRPILHLVPHWNWAGSEGKPIKVLVATNVEKVELFLNGKSLGQKPVDKYQMLTTDVTYEAGKLEAVGFKGDKEVARFAVETTGAPAGLRIISDRPSLAGEGSDAQPVTVQVVDAQGRVVPNASQMVNFELSGPGAIIGLNNGDPNCHEPEKGTQHTVFHGLAQVILQSEVAGHGKLTLRATSPGLAVAETVIEVTVTPARPAVPIAYPTLVIRNWRLSPISAERPDPNQPIGGTDMNTWANAQPGRRLPTFNDGRFAIYRAQFTPRIGVQRSGGHVTLVDVTGKAQVWIDGQLAGEKTDAARGTFTVPISAGEEEHTVSILIEAPATGSAAGLGGPVTVE
jgi:beta-galactosidase